MRSPISRAFALVPMITIFRKCFEEEKPFSLCMQKNKKSGQNEESRLVKDKKRYQRTAEVQFQGKGEEAEKKPQDQGTFKGDAHLLPAGAPYRNPVEPQRISGGRPAAGRQYHNPQIPGRREQFGIQQTVQILGKSPGQMESAEISQGKCRACQQQIGEKLNPVIKSCALSEHTLILSGPMIIA